MVKHLSTMQETWVRALVGKIPWRRKWQSTPVLLPGESHGQRSLVGYSLWGCKELGTTERLHYHFHSVLWSTQEELLVFSFFHLSSHTEDRSDDFQAPHLLDWQPEVPESVSHTLPSLFVAVNYLRRPLFLYIVSCPFSTIRGHYSSESPLFLLHHNICLFLSHWHQLKNAVIIPMLINR